MRNMEYLSVKVGAPDPISNVNLMITQADFRMEAHTHSFYHINHILEGSVTFEVDGKHYEVEAGCMIAVPPGCSHAIYSRNGYKQIGIDVRCVKDSRGLCDEVAALCNAFCVQQLPITVYEARESMERMRFILSKPTKGNIVRALNIAEEKILELLEVLREKNSDRFLEQFTAMLSQHQPWELSLSDMCRILCISRTQLERKSKCAFGCGAAEYCARLRYGAVCGLLKYDMTLEEIAEKTGFYDAGHLSKFFTARAGMTPGQYRKITG